MQSTRLNHSQKTGWLHKRGGRIQTWHKRWFMLTGDLLFYYKTPQDSRPTGTIPLAGNNVVRHQDDSRQPHSYKFEIVAGSGRNYITSTHDSYMISAETSEEADSWVAAIKRVLHEPYGGGMFGRDLGETMTVEARLGGAYIPILVHRCAKFILDHGVDETGIFRLPGQTSRVQALKETYDNGSQIDIPPTEDIHTVASLLKLYLRELPKPVIPYGLFDDAIKVTKLNEQNTSEGIVAMNALLKQLPTANYNLLKYLCRFLFEVAKHSDNNKMTYANLATVFGPNIMRSQSPDPHHLIESSNASASFVCILIKLQEELFPISNDEKPPKRLSLVNLTDISDYLKVSTKTTGSVFVKPHSPKPEAFRGRLGSLPPRFLSPPASDLVKPNKGKKFNGLESPRRSKKFAYELTTPNFLHLDSSSGRVSPIMISNLNEDDDECNPNLFAPSDDNQSPKQQKSPSETSHVRTETTGTVSPDLLVNSIAKEMEHLERQLQVLKDSFSKKKKEARLWKARYNQERRARLAADERISTLQSLVDQTFKQFALDDSEDEDFEEESGSSSGDSVNESMTSSEIGQRFDLYSPSPIPGHVRHIRSNSTHFN